MLDVLQRHIEASPHVCVTGTWINTLSKAEQEAFAKIKEDSIKIQLSALYSDLNEQNKLPFKITAFRGHFRGYCSCQK
jgi:hypothetical protein